MNVLLVGPKKPPLGGIQRFAEYVLRIKEEEIKIYFMPDNIPGDWRPNTRKSSFTWNFIKRDGLFVSLKVICFIFIKYIFFLYKIINYKIDYVHILSSNNWGFFRNSIYILLSKIFHKRCIFHHLGQIDEMLINATFLRLKIIKFILNSSDLHVTQSENISKVLSNYTYRPVRTIYNPVDSCYYGNNKKNNRKNRLRELNFVTVGYLGHSKGTYDIIDSVKRNKEKLILNNVKFKLIGGGDVNFFRDIIFDLNIENLIEIAGELSDIEKYEVLSNWADVFLLPSRAEGQPIAVLEAMACSLPVIVGRVGSLPEFIDHNMGYLVAPGNSFELDNAILDCIKDSELLKIKGQHCKSRIENYHSFDIFKEKILNLYAWE